MSSSTVTNRNVQPPATAQHQASPPRRRESSSAVLAEEDVPASHAVMPSVAMSPTPPPAREIAGGGATPMHQQTSFQRSTISAAASPDMNALFSSPLNNTPRPPAPRPSSTNGRAPIDATTTDAAHAQIAADELLIERLKKEIIAREERVRRRRQEVDAVWLYREKKEEEVLRQRGASASPSRSAGGAPPAATLPPPGAVCSTLTPPTPSIASSSTHNNNTSNPATTQDNSIKSNNTTAIISGIVRRKDGSLDGEVVGGGTATAGPFSFPVDSNNATPVHGNPMAAPRSVSPMMNNNNNNNGHGNNNLQKFVSFAENTKPDVTASSPSASNHTSPSTSNINPLSFSGGGGSRRVSMLATSGGGSYDLSKRRSSAMRQVTDASLSILAAFGHHLAKGRNHNDDDDEDSVQGSATNTPNKINNRGNSGGTDGGAFTIVDIVTPGPEEVEHDRCGDVLSSKSILKRDLFEAAFSHRREHVGVFAGAPNFRIVPKFNVGGVSQAHASGIRAVLNEVRKVYVSTAAAPVVWVTLREEPMIYVNGRSHVIRDSEHPQRPVAIVGVTGDRIESIENKLKDEVILEAQRNGGNICVHKEQQQQQQCGNNGGGGGQQLDMLWEAVEGEEGVATIAEVFAKISKSMNLNLINHHDNNNNNPNANAAAAFQDNFYGPDEAFHLKYIRHPVSQGAGPQPKDFQRVFELCVAYPNSPIIYNCQTGRGRSSLMMVISTIVKFYQFCQRDVTIIDGSLMNADDVSGGATSYRTILRLISLLPHGGAIHERRVAVLAELSDKIYSITAHVNALFKTPHHHHGSNANGGNNVNIEALIALRQYAYLICFSCFCEAKLWSSGSVGVGGGGGFEGTFSEWFDEYPEIKTLLHNMVHQNKHQASSERIEAPIGEDREVAMAVKRRKGNVLSSNMILCSQPKEPQPVADVVGEAVVLDENEANSPSDTTAAITGVTALRQLCPGVPIFTCGKATEQGRNALLYKIRLAFPSISGIQWISTRDEPMVFINGTGYTLGDYSAYNLLQRQQRDDSSLAGTARSRNNHHNGGGGPSGAGGGGRAIHIGAEKMEELEDKLVQDILAEAKAHDGFIIVHEMQRMGPSHLNNNGGDVSTSSSAAGGVSNADSNSTAASPTIVAKRIKVETVAAPRGVMKVFAEENKIKYTRMPMPMDWVASPKDFDTLLEHVCNNIGLNEAIIINDTDGALRTSIILNFITIVRAARLHAIKTNGAGSLRDLKSVDKICQTLAYHHQQHSSGASGNNNNADIVDTTLIVPAANYYHHSTLAEDLMDKYSHIQHSGGGGRAGSVSSSVSGGGVGGTAAAHHHHHPLPELLVASQMCQMLAAGSLLFTTSSIIEVGGRGPEWNVLDALEVAVEGSGNNSSNNNKPSTASMSPAQQRRALNIARKYLMVLLCALYIDDQKTFNPNLPLSKWCSGLKEINFLLEKFDERPQQSLTFIVKDNLMEEHEGDMATQRRSGEVLTANFIMKADHFKGCAKRGIGPSIVGAPNFRKVDFVNVYGVAIPTRVGIQNVLAGLGALDQPLLTYPDKPAEVNGDDINTAFPSPTVFDAKFRGADYALPNPKSKVIWVNLREEPFLYVADRPFVFRDLAAPYVNVELTGIESHKVEHVETQLKRDILNEAQRYNGKFLVHDEGTKGVGDLVGLWEESNEESVTTVREFYEGLATNKNARVKLLRMPVTDEQSPELRDFDLLSAALLPHIAASSIAPVSEEDASPLSFIFNCQFGRGRTTTGMVICCLLIGTVNPDYFVALADKFMLTSYGNPNASPPRNGSASPNRPRLTSPLKAGGAGSNTHVATAPSAADGQQQRPLYPEGATRYANGEYSCIMKLKAVLADGRRAKHNVDLVLEACNRMQNLRTAIEDLKKASESVDKTEEDRARAHHSGVHYLLRYLNLIAFASYLAECYDKSEQCLHVTFAEWVEGRPELLAIQNEVDLD